MQHSSFYVSFFFPRGRGFIGREKVAEEREEVKKREREKGAGGEREVVEEREGGKKSSFYVSIKTRNMILLLMNYNKTEDQF